MVVKRIGVLSFAKISGALYGLIGLLAGAVFSVIALVTAAVNAASDASPVFGVLFGVGAIVLFPVLYGAMGFIGGLIGAGLYNLLAGWMGGIELELQ